MQKSTTELDQSKRGLQDDHDPTDLGQRSANTKRGVQYKPRDERDSEKSQPEH
jgi:hypothetical protein